jgi:hypothetical protein
MTFPEPDSLSASIITATATAAASMMMAAAVITVVVIAAGDAVGDQADDGGTQECRAWINHLTRASMRIVGGGATGSHAEAESGENEAVEGLFHAPV